MADRVPLRPRRTVPTETPPSLSSGTRRQPSAAEPDASVPEYIPRQHRAGDPQDEMTPIELNVLTVGQAGAGKSTAIEAITGQRVSSIASGLNDGTTTTTRYTVHQKVKGVKYIIHFWDTPGLTGQLAKQRGVLQLLFNALDVMQENGVHELDAIFLFVKTARMEALSTWNTIKTSILSFFGPKFDVNLYLIATHCATDSAAKELFDRLEKSSIGRALTQLAKDRRHFHNIPAAFADDDFDDDIDDDDDDDADVAAQREHAAKAHADHRHFVCKMVRRKYLKIIRTSTTKPISISGIRANVKRCFGSGSRAKSVEQEESKTSTPSSSGKGGSSAATAAPTSSSSSASASSAGKTRKQETSSEESSCFARTATVELEDGTTKEMGTLQVGDRVLTASGGYAPVRAWLHRSTTAASSFLVISATSANGDSSNGDSSSMNGRQPHHAHQFTLRVSPNHFVAVTAGDAANSAGGGGMQFKAANEVVVGDCLIDANGAAAEVTGITHEEREDGYFAPFVGGDMTLVVDGVVAHVFADVTPTTINTVCFSGLMSAAVALAALPGMGQERQPAFCMHPLAAGLRSLYRTCGSVSQLSLSSHLDLTTPLPSFVTHHKMGL